MKILLFFALASLALASPPITEECICSNFGDCTCDQDAMDKLYGGGKPKTLVYSPDLYPSRAHRYPKSLSSFNDENPFAQPGPFYLDFFPSDGLSFVPLEDKYPRPDISHSPQARRSHKSRSNSCYLCDRTGDCVWICE